MIEIIKTNGNLELVRSAVTGKYAVLGIDPSGQFVSMLHNPDGSRNVGSRWYAAIWQSRAKASALYQESIELDAMLDRIDATREKDVEH